MQKLKTNSKTAKNKLLKGVPSYKIIDNPIYKDSFCYIEPATIDKSKTITSE